MFVGDRRRPGVSLAYQRLCTHITLSRVRMRTHGSARSAHALRSLHSRRSRIALVSRVSASAHTLSHSSQAYRSRISAFAQARVSPPLHTHHTLACQDAQAQRLCTHSAHYTRVVLVSLACQSLCTHSFTLVAGVSLAYQRLCTRSCVSALQRPCTHSSMMMSSWGASRGRRGVVANRLLSCTSSRRHSSVRARRRASGRAQRPQGHQK